MSAQGFTSFSPTSPIHRQGLARQSSRGFGGREWVDVPMGTEDLDLSSTSPSTQREEVKAILLRARDEQEAQDLLREKFLQQGAFWSPDSPAQYVVQGFRAGKSLEDLRHEMGATPKPFAERPQGPSDFKDRQAWATRDLTRVLSQKRPPSDQPSAPRAAPVPATLPAAAPIPPMPAVAAPILQDSNLKRLLELNQEDFERWVREVFTPYMQKHFPIYNTLPYMILPRWSPGSFGAPAVRGIVIGSVAKKLPYSEISLKENLISIAYQSSNNHNDAWFLAQQFAGILLAGREERTFPILVIHANNFKFSNEAERLSKKNFFQEIAQAFAALHIRYALPDGDLCGPLWEEIKSWMVTTPEQRAKQDREACAFKRAFQGGRCGAHLASRPEALTQGWVC